MRSLQAYRKYLVFLLVLLPLLRAITWWHLTGSFSHHDSALWVQRIYLPFHLHADTLVMGLILSNLAASGDGDRGLRASLWILPVSAVVCFPLVVVQREVWSFTEVALLFGACARFAISPMALRVPLLDSKFFYVVSRLSFGMYLNHRYFESFVVDLFIQRVPVTQPGVQFLAIYATLSLVSSLVALGTFCLVEHPFLALRSRWLERG